MILELPSISLLIALLLCIVALIFLYNGYTTKKEKEQYWRDRYGKLCNQEFYLFIMPSNNSSVVMSTAHQAAQLTKILLERGEAHYTVRFFVTNYNELAQRFKHHIPDDLVE